MPVSDPASDGGAGWEFGCPQPAIVSIRKTKASQVAADRGVFRGNMTTLRRRGAKVRPSSPFSWWGSPDHASHGARLHMAPVDPPYGCFRNRNHLES